MDKAKEWQIGKVQFCNSKKKKKKIIHQHNQRVGSYTGENGSHRIKK